MGSGDLEIGGSGDRASARRGGTKRPKTKSLTTKDTKEHERDSGEKRDESIRFYALAKSA